MATAIMKPPEEKRLTKNGVELKPTALVGKLTLTRRYVPPPMPFDPPSYQPTAVWYAVCECGEETCTTEPKLVAGIVNACRLCMDKAGKRRTAQQPHAPIVPAFPGGPAEVPGTTIGALTLIEKVDDRKWKVQCKCGNVLPLSNRVLFSRYRRPTSCPKCCVE